MRIPYVLPVLLLIAPAVAGAAAPFIVENGRPNAEIVIAENPPRLVKLAADELQVYLARISGARLPVVTMPGDSFPVRIFVGRSRWTDELGVSVEGLKHGAFRLVSGDRWLVLLGGDFDYAPREPWARSHGDRPRAQQAWDELTGGTWGNPLASVFRHRHAATGIWSHDGGGSLNAVCAFLRDLGVRWYMPGDLGEVVPEMSSISLPELDRTVQPDFPLRYWFGAYFAYTAEDVMWDRRLGVNSGYELLGAGMHEHGMRLIHGRAEMQAAHPEYYALIGDKRDTTFRGTGHACFSSEGLFREAVNFARAVYERLGEPAVSFWPQDGYHQCQCDLCAGKPASELVWGFVDRAARELYRDYPDRLVTCGAYGAYRTPPETIEKFSPNVAVFISTVGRPMLAGQERWDEYLGFVESWRAKLSPGRILRNENNRYALSGDETGARPVPFPIIHPRAFARDLRALRGISLGDWNEVSRSSLGVPGKTFWRAPGLDHLNLYVNAAFLWDAGRDLDALLDEYYRLFYGPAAAEMKAAFEFAETAVQKYPSPNPGQIGVEDRIQFLELLHAARAAAGEDTVHAKRVALIIGELQPLDELRREREIAARRTDVPEFTALLTMDGEKFSPANESFVLDGKLDEPFWTVYRSGGGLSDSVTGGRSAPATSFLARWYQGHIYFGIRCAEPDMANLKSTAVESGDPAILDDDRVEIMLETDVHAWYRLAVNPAGALLDMDMAAAEGQRERWLSNAEAAVNLGEDHWSVEVRIPVVSGKEGIMDPLHFVVGHQPSHHRSRAWPWHFNLGRVRVREGEPRVSAWSPTGSDDLRDAMKFGAMYLRD